MQISFLILKNGFCKRYIIIELIYVKELMFLKVITVKNVLSTAIGILIMDSNFQNLLVMVAMICLCCVLMLAILLLSQLKVLTIGITKSEAIYLWENSVLEDRGYIQNAFRGHQY